MDDIDRIILLYLEEKGIDPDSLDTLSEEEFESLCSDAQIDAYLLGKKNATT